MVVAAALMVPASSHALADGLQAGLWSVRQSPVINDMTGPVQQNLRCLTAEAVADLDKTFSPVSRTTNSACEQIEHELTPQRLKWRLQCTGQLDMDVAGEFVFENPAALHGHGHDRGLDGRPAHAEVARHHRGGVDRRVPVTSCWRPASYIAPLRLRA